jgi:hypothetical protein
MATSGTYYLNGPTLSSSTAVFTDDTLSTCAPDGFYSEGSIVREQVDCVLLPPVVCPSCAAPCNTPISGTGGPGLYYVDTNTGTATGAIIVKFNAFSVPDGILAQLGPNLYNGMSSQYFGWLQGTAGLPTYVGEAASDCGLVAGSPYSGVIEYEYQSGAFVDSGNTVGVTVVSGQLDLTTSNAGVCTMVIPKTSNAYSVLSTQIFSLCPATSFSIEIECPEELSTWTGSALAASGSGACVLNAATTYYYVHVNGVGGVLGLYDMVFSDANGEFPLAAGYYNTGSMSPSYDWIQVDANGVVISFGVCTAPINYIVEKCYTNEQLIVTVPALLSPGERVLVVGHPGCIWEVVSSTVSPSNATFLSITTDPCTVQCSSWILTNSLAIDISFNFVDCDGATVTFSLGGGQTITLCAREILTTPTGLGVSIDDCECEPQTDVWELNGCCANDTVIAISNIPINIGDLVKVSDTSIDDCWYEVIGLSGSTPTTTIVLSNLGAYGCDAVCCDYVVCNPDTVNPHSIDYTNCDGIPSNLTLPPLTCANVCARSGSFGPSVLTVSFNSCTC